MIESKLTEYKIESIYKFLSIVYMNVEAGIDFWNFNQEAFVHSDLLCCAQHNKSIATRQ